MKFSKLRKVTKELGGDKPGQADFQRKNVRRIKLNMKKKDKNNLDENDIVQNVTHIVNKQKDADKVKRWKKHANFSGWKSYHAPLLMTGMPPALAKKLEENEQVMDSSMSEPSVNLVDAVKAAIAGEPAAFQTAINTALQAKAVDAIGQYKQVVAQQIFNDQPPSEDYEEPEEGPEDEDDVEVTDEDDGEYETPEDEDDNTSEEE